VCLRRFESVDIKGSEHVIKVRADKSRSPMRYWHLGTDSDVLTWSHDTATTGILGFLEPVRMITLIDPKNGVKSEDN